MSSRARRQLIRPRHRKDSLNKALFSPPSKPPTKPPTNQHISPRISRRTNSSSALCTPITRTPSPFLLLRSPHPTPPPTPQPSTSSHKLSPPPQQIHHPPGMSSRSPSPTDTQPTMGSRTTCYPPPGRRTEGKAAGKRGGAVPPLEAIRTAQPVARSDHVVTARLKASPACA